MKINLISFLLLFFCCTCNWAIGQSAAVSLSDVKFRKGGDVTKSGENCYQLTKDRTWSSGAIWYPSPINLAADFENKGLKYTTQMPAEDDHNSGQGRSWKSTLSVQTDAEAEQKLEELGYSWQWLADGSLRATTPVLPAVIDLGNGKKVFYNQLIAAFMGWKGVRENPSSAITFGDDSEIPVDGLQMAVSLSEKYTFDVPWQDGDVALIDNYMAMHGRRPYAGARKRQVLVALAID